MKKIIPILAIVGLLIGGAAMAKSDKAGIKGNALIGTLSAEDFGVVNYDTGLGTLKGYTAGFGLTDSTFEGAKYVVVKLYAENRLLQINTATDKFKTDIIGTQFSSPFDIFGDFDYVADGYWTNVRKAEYGQHMIPTKVVAKIKLANNKVVTATNTNLTGDSTTIYPEPIESSTLTDKKLCKDYGWMSFVNPTLKNQGQCVSYVVKKYRRATLNLYEKNPSDWSIVEDGAVGKMIYKPIAENFKYSFVGYRLDSSTAYTLIYYPDPWPGTGLICLGSGTTTDTGSKLYLKGSVDTGNLPISNDDNKAGAKIWLVKSSDVDCTAKQMIGWNPAEYLFEGNLITFTKISN